MVFAHDLRKIIISANKDFASGNTSNAEEIIKSLFYRDDIKSSTTKACDDVINTIMLLNLRPPVEIKLLNIIRIFENINKKEPENFIFKYALAHLYFENNNFEEADNAYRDACQLNPDLPDNYYDELSYIDIDKAKFIELQEDAAQKIEYDSDIPEKNQSGVSFFIYKKQPGLRCKSVNPPIFVENYADVDFAKNLSISIQSQVMLAEDFCAHISGAHVAGRRTIITRDNEIFTDNLFPYEVHKSIFMDRLTQSWFSEHVFIKLVNGKYLSRRCRLIDREISDPIIFLGTVEAHNYGSYLFRCLPKLAQLEKFGIPENLKILVDVTYPWQRELLNLAGIPDERIIPYDSEKHVYHIKEMFFPSVKNWSLYLDEDTVLFYRNLLKKHDIQTTQKNKIYVSRLAATAKNPRHRPLLNEQELVDELVKRGFQIINPEDHSILDQMRIFNNAAVIVTLGGAGLFNCIFTPPSALIIDIEGLPDWIIGHMRLFDSLGHTYGIIIGEADPTDLNLHKRWKLDIGKAIRRIDTVLNANKLSKNLSETHTSRRINYLAGHLDLNSYLEILSGDRQTFITANFEKKIAFDRGANFDETSYKLIQATDTETFDMICFSNVHLFEQVLDEFIKSLLLSNEKTIFLIDNVFPCDVYSSLKNYQDALNFRAKEGAYKHLSGHWHSDVYKLIFFIHDFFPIFSYVTINTNGNPQTILWRKPRTTFSPAINNLEKISRLDYFDMHKHLGVFNFLSEEEALPYITKQMAPAD